MSATFRLAAKKKISQHELRRLMTEQKNVKHSSKINNPLAKYNEAGQLMCVLCQSIVRSENVWQVHLNAKQHKDKVAEAKKLKELTNNFTTSAKLKTFKRPGDVPTNGPQEKKIKGILKNAPSLISSELVSNNSIKPNHTDEVNSNPVLKIDQHPSTSVAVDERDTNLQSQASSDPIPEGFFDDPILDAKARHMEYKDPVEEEWDKFQKEIREEASASAEIIAGEQEEATAERQIDEIDEQIRNWSRVLDLELKKDETKKKSLETEQITNEENGEKSDDEIDIDEFLDWRAKKSYR